MHEREKNWILWSLFLMMILLNADQMVMSPNINMIEKEFRIGDSQIGYIASSFTVIGAILSLIWGFLSDKYSRKKLLFYAVLVGEIPCMLSAFATSYVGLFTLRALTGIGVGAMFPVSFSLVGDIFDAKERGKVAAYLSTAVSIGIILGMVIGGYVGGVYGWRIPFLLVSIPNIVIILIFYKIIEEPKRGAAEEKVEDLVRKGYVYSSNVKLSDYLKLFTIKTDLFLFLQGISGTIPWGAIPYFLITFLNRSRGLSIAQATTIFIIFGLGNIIGILYGGLLGSFFYKKSPKYMPLFCAITTFMGTFFVLWTLGYKGGNYIVLASLGFFSAALASMTGPNVKTMLLNVNEPENRGRIFSIFNLTDSLGTGIGKLVGGLISTALGSLGAALNISALFWLPCAVLLFFVTAFMSKDIGRLNKIMEEKRRQMESGI